MKCREALCPTLRPNRRSKQQNRIQSAIAAVATAIPSRPTVVYLSRDMFLAVVREMIRRDGSEKLRQASDESLLHIYSLGWINFVSLTHGGRPLQLRYLPGLPKDCVVPMFDKRLKPSCLDQDYVVLESTKQPDKTSYVFRSLTLDESDRLDRLGPIGIHLDW